jgi:DNA primase
MDVIAYARIGLENVVAIMGVALSDEHLNALHTLTKLNTVILSFDNDTAGVQATVDNGRKLMENGFNVYVVANYPKAYKDVDELLNESGDAALQAILDNRVDFITFLIENEFINKKPLDEIQKSVNGIIHDMLEFGQNSLLLRQQHLKLLADKSHLAFDDLKIKYDQDFDNFLNGSGKKKDIKCSQKPYKPTNDIGLNQSFVESENVDLKEDESVQNYNAIQVLQSELKTKENRLTEAFDRLILTVINCPSGFAKVEAEINLLTVQFPLVQQKFIFKALQYLFGRNELINEQSLANVLKEQSKAKNSVAVNYQSAYEYFMSKIDDQLYQIYHKEKLCHKSEERIKTLIKSIQLLKYEISIGETTIDIWKLKKENLDENSTKIKQLNVQLIETKKLFNS